MLTLSPVLQKMEALRRVEKEKPPRLGGGRRRDGYNLRIWMGASAGRFCNKPGLGVQPLLFNGVHLRWICEIFPNPG